MHREYEFHRGYGEFLWISADSDAEAREATEQLTEEDIELVGIGASLTGRGRTWDPENNVYDYWDVEDSTE